MTLRECVHLQNDGADADDLRRLTATLSGDAEGIIDTGDLAVTEKSGTPNMSIDVAAGRALILGTENAQQGTYFVESDATENLAVAAADPTNPRKDLVVAQVRDAVYSGVDDDWIIAVIAGTPAGSPAEPSLPDNAIALALIDVAALASSIVDANITDRRDIWPGAGGSEWGALRANSTTSVPHSTWTKITLSDVLGASQPAITAVAGRLICKTAGIFKVNARVYSAAGGSSSSARQISLIKNGSTTVGNDTTIGLVGTGSEWSGSLLTSLELAVDDYLEVEAFHGAGSAINFGDTGAKGTSLSVERLGPAS